MSDLPPPADAPAPAPAPAPEPSPVPAGRSDMGAILAQLDPAVAAQLAPGLGVNLDQVTVAAAPSPLDSVPKGAGPDGLDFSAAPAPRKVLTIGDQMYRCRPKVPGKILRDALEASAGLAASAQGDGAALTAANLGLIDLMLSLIQAAMYPDDFARFMGRYDGTDLRRYRCHKDETTGEVTIAPPDPNGDPTDEVDAIDMGEISTYGSRLTEAYTRRPTAGHEPSGS